MKQRASIAWLIAACGILACVSAQAADTRGPLSDGEIDGVVNRTMAAFAVPGIAVGIVKDGRLVYAKGHGVRELGQRAAVDADTMFAIGSNSKAFTTAALAMLVDAGRLHWDDRVIDYLPEFRMADPFVTREFTVRDLVTHRSGLGIGAGDLLFVPLTDFTRQDVIRALRYLKPVTSFRSQFAYDNLLYVVAGEIVAAVSGMTWEDFVTSRILAPLDMSACAVASDRLPIRANWASPHAVIDGTLRTVSRLELPLVGPAGGIQCNVTGMSRWVAAQLAQGQTASGSRLFSAMQSEEMWTPQTAMRPSGTMAELTRTHFLAYGLGWGLDDVDGYKRVSHNGGLPGMVTHVSMIPELNVGVIVLTNQQERFALSAVALSILEGYMGVARRDWVSLAQAAKAELDQRMREADHASAPAAAAEKDAAPIDLGAYVGTFVDAWRGPATISRREQGLELTFSHTDGLSGSLTPLSRSLFVVRWSDRSLNADAYVRFARDFSDGVSGFTMRPVSASTDFSFDFQDLDFIRTQDIPPRRQ